MIQPDAALDLAIVLGAIGVAWVSTRWWIYPALGVFGLAHGVFLSPGRPHLVPLIIVHGTWDMTGIYGVYNSAG